MTVHSKAIRHELRQLAGRAHEEELRRALLTLANHFDAWKAGELDSFDLSDQIHAFHNGASRVLYNRYTGGMHEVTVASALARGILTPDDISPETLVVLARQIALLEADDS